MYHVCSYQRRMKRIHSRSSLCVRRCRVLRRVFWIWIDRKDFCNIMTWREHNIYCEDKTQNRKLTCPSWWPHPFPNEEWSSMTLPPWPRDRGKSSTRCWWRHRNPFPTTKADKMWGSLLPQHVSNLCIYANTDLKGDGVLSLGRDDIVGVCCCCFCCLLLLLLVVGGCCCCMVCNTCSLVALSSLPSNKKWGSMRSTKAEHLMMT